MKLAYHPLRWCACFFCLLTSIITGCGHRKAAIPKTEIDSLSFASLTKDVVTLISDSGVTKYKLTADLWYTYDTPENKWYFPNGIYLEQFDTLFNIIASVQADTAYYYQSRNLWELKNNVRIMNQKGEKFYAVTLYWDELNEEIYSHDPIRIIRSEGDMLESLYGFKSNQLMTKYELYSSRGQMDVKDEPIVVDSVPASTPTTTAPAAPSAPTPSNNPPVPTDQPKQPSRTNNNQVR